MLSLSLRQPRLVASFCSTARVLSASRSSSDLTPVTNLLQTAAGDKVGDKGRSEEGLAGVSGRVPKVISFRLNDFIHPHDTTYKTRTEGKRPPKTARALLGPSKALSQKADPFYLLDINPSEYSFDPTILSHFVSDMGKILPRGVTRLTTKNQRQIAKAIRRAKVMGIMPIFSRRNILDPENSRNRK